MGMTIVYCVKDILMHTKGNKMRNRYGDEYSWEDIGNNQFLFHMSGNSLGYGRIGGKEGQTGLDYDDLGMFDPSGGPYVTIGSIVEGRKVTHIKSTDNSYIVTVGD